MTLIKKIKDKKVNFEFNKEYIKVVTDKITSNDASFITRSFEEMHPADAADIIEHLSENDRESLIKLNNFKIDPEVFVELNESVQSEIIKYLSSDAIVRILKKLNYQDLNNKNFKKIGADIPFFLQNRDSLVRGIGEITINQTFPKYYFILAKPNEDCSTFDMYNSIDSNKLNYDLTSDTNQIEENDYGNDFEEIIKAKYYETKDLLKFMENLPNLIFTRLTGSGSCIFAAFNTKKNAEVAYQIFKKNYPDLWCMQVENNYK